MNNKKTITSNNFYTKKYTEQKWLQQRKEDAQTLLNKIAGLELFQPNSKVLDAGCGSGNLANEVSKRYGSMVYGIDLNEVAVQKAKELGIEVKVGDLDQTWPYADSSFDVVTAAEIIEHVINPDHFLNEARRVLKKGGHLVITTPNLAAWFNRLIFLFGYQPFFLEASTVDKTIGLKFTRKFTPNKTPVGHTRCFTLKALKDILELHGYQIILVKGNTGYYLPKFMKPLDQFFSFFPNLATDLTVVAKKQLLSQSTHPLNPYRRT